MNTPCQSLSSRFHHLVPVSSTSPEKPLLFSDVSPQSKRNYLTASGDQPNTGPWTHEEHNKFLEAMSKYGNNWTKVCEVIGTRTPNQARSHAQKYYNKRRKQAIDQVLAEKSGGKKKLFAVTREFINRTAIKSALELMDVPSRLPKKRPEGPETGKAKSDPEKAMKEKSKKVDEEVRFIAFFRGKNQNKK